MKKMRVLGKTAIILTPSEMLRKFGERIDYVVDPEDNTVYVDCRLIDMEIKRFNGNKTEKEAAIDVYRMIRAVEGRKTRYEALRDTIPKNCMKS